MENILESIEFKCVNDDNTLETLGKIDLQELDIDNSKEWNKDWKFPICKYIFTGLSKYRLNYIVEILSTHNNNILSIDFIKSINLKIMFNCILNSKKESIDIRELFNMSKMMLNITDDNLLFKTHRIDLFNNLGRFTITLAETIYSNEPNVMKVTMELRKYS